VSVSVCVCVCVLYVSACVRRYNRYDTTWYHIVRCVSVSVSVCVCVCCVCVCESEGTIGMIPHGTILLGV